MIQSKTVVMLLTNPFRPDPRVRKEALSLLTAGYKVILICWDRMLEYPSRENIEGIDIYRIRVKSKYSAGSQQLLFLFVFLFRAFLQIHRYKPDVIHCHDLDTTLAGAIYAKLHHVPWIFDAHECYPEQIGPQVNRMIYKLLLFLEKYMSVRASRVITVGNVLGDHFRDFGVSVTIVGNYPLEAQIDNYKTEEFRNELSIPSIRLVVAYIGGFTLARAIEPLILTADLLTSVSILIAGDGPQRKRIEELTSNRPNVIYRGWIDHSLIPVYMAGADMVYYGLKINDGNSQYSVPNTLFTAMAAGKPIITTNVGEIASIVNMENCGIVITEATPELIAAGIRNISDTTSRQLLGINGRNAFINKYNWSIAEGKLLDLYASVLAQ